MNSDPVRLVAIVGGSASGKTWLADQLSTLLGCNAGRLTQDHYYRDWSHLPPEMRGQVNFDHPDALDWIDLEDALKSLRSGRAARQPVYDFHTHTRREGAILVPACRVMLVDGLWLMHRPDIRELFDLTVFLHCPEEERLRRRMARDVSERGRTPESVEYQFQTMVAPMHRRFVEPQSQWADVVLSHPYAPHQVAELHEKLSGLLVDDALLPVGARDSFRTELHTLLQPAPALP